jgi:hypothetical protein
VAGRLCACVAVAVIGYGMGGSHGHSQDLGGSTSPVVGSTGDGTESGGEVQLPDPSLKDDWNTGTCVTGGLCLLTPDGARAARWRTWSLLVYAATLRPQNTGRPVVGGGNDRQSTAIASGWLAP